MGSTDGCMTRLTLSRRTFLGGVAGSAAAILAACGGLVGQPAHLAEVGQPQQFGEFWPHLPCFRVRTVAPAENQIGLFAGQQQGQGASCGERIRAREGAVGEQDSAVSAQSETV